MKPTINKTKENKKQKTHTQNRKNKKIKTLRKFIYKFNFLLCTSPDNTFQMIVSLSIKMASCILVTIVLHKSAQPSISSIFCFFL